MSPAFPSHQNAWYFPSAQCSSSYSVRPSPQAFAPENERNRQRNKENNDKTRTPGVRGQSSRGLPKEKTSKKSEGRREAKYSPNPREETRSRMQTPYPPEANKKQAAPSHRYARSSIEYTQSSTQNRKLEGRWSESRETGRARNLKRSTMTRRSRRYRARGGVQPGIDGIELARVVKGRCCD